MMGAKVIMSAAFLAMLSACATTGGAGDTAAAPERAQRGLEATETNDGGLRQAPPPPEDGESAVPEPVS